MTVCTVTVEIVELWLSRKPINCFKSVFKLSFCVASDLLLSTELSLVQLYLYFGQILARSNLETIASENI